MASVYRPVYTKPFPEGAEIIDRDGTQYARWIDRHGKKQTARITTGNDGTPKQLRQSASYVAKYRDAVGRLVKASTGCRTKEAAQQRLNELLREVEQVKAGVLTDEQLQAADHRAAPLSASINDYLAHLKAKDVTPARIKQTRTRLEKSATDCNWKTLGDVSGPVLEAWLSERREVDDMSAANWNAHRSAWVGFGNWAKRRTVARLTLNPFTEVPRANEKADPRRKRRAMTAEEFGRLLKAARLRPVAESGRKTLKRDEKPTNARSRQTWKKLDLEYADLEEAHARGLVALKNSPDRVAKLEQDGRARQLVYKLLVLTGLRRKELGRVTLAQCELDGPTPHINLNAVDEKNREGNTVPLRQDVAADLSRHLTERLHALQTAARQAGRPVPVRLAPTERLIHVPTGLVKIFDRDLSAAGIPKRDDRGRTLDVHALRTTFCSMLSQAGVPLRTAQAAMRHSDPSLTANVYTDPKLINVSGALEKLPNWPLDGDGEIERESATGTYASDAVAQEIARNLASALVPVLGPNSGNGCANESFGDNRSKTRTEDEMSATRCGVDGNRREAIEVAEGHDGRYWTRTSDLIRVKDAL